jgi:transposase
VLAKGEIVVMGDPPAHEIASVRAMLEATGMRPLYLPPYSPDLDPIEMAFAKPKALPREAAPRTVARGWTISRAEAGERRPAPTRVETVAAEGRFARLPE